MISVKLYLYNHIAMHFELCILYGRVDLVYLCYTVADVTFIGIKDLFEGYIFVISYL